MEYKKEDKRVNIVSVTDKFSNIEKEINLLKKELDSVLEDNKNKDKQLISSKEIVQKIINSYENTIKQRNNDLRKEKDNSLSIIESYESKLKDKDEEIKKIILASDDSPIVLKSLEKEGVPKEICLMSKSELCKN